MRIETAEERAQMHNREIEERELTRAELLSLPWPTPEQQAAFAAHVCDAHSWYKHLLLMTGGEFVIFLAGDAGQGYPDAAPRLHYSWKTTSEYRTRFGHLDYMWRDTTDGQFDRDTSPIVRLPHDLLEATRFTLFPFASNDMNAQEACLWKDHHDDAFEQLRSGFPHPAGPLVIAWQDSQAAMEELWCGLSDGEQDLVVELGPSEPAIEPAALSPAVEQYLRVESLANSVYAGLQEAEEAKVRAAIGALAAVLLRWLADE